MSTAPLRFLTPGQLVPFGGDRVVAVSEKLAAEFVEGDRLVVVHETGDLLHIPRPDHERVHQAVSAAVDAFVDLARVDDAQLTRFFEVFADRLADDVVYAPIAAANRDDVEAAQSRQRSTTRLALTASMREGMIDGLRAWQHAEVLRDQQLASIDHGSWTVETRRAPLGVVGFVFEGRPNVFADATGVLRSGNAVVFRIGSDALRTARAIMEHAVVPALHAARLPIGSVQLIASAAHAAGWALFADHRLGLAVARGSGGAVAQLGAVARQHGVPVSLHGTGGAWMIVAPDADPAVVRLAVSNSLDRKVCNTMNVCCIVRTGASRAVPLVMEACREAARLRGTDPVFHLTRSAQEHSPSTELSMEVDALGTEWEWENAPEVSLVVVESIDEAVELFNTFSPRFAASLIGGTAVESQRFYESVDAPFVGDGFTRWVDGQFAFLQPELGLSNWQSGRLFARGGVLSGDSVFTVRTRAAIRDHSLHR
jgi:glutamate-5-semialdehyde dehydrogenase